MKLSRYFNLVVALGCVLLMAACSSDDDFTIRGTIRENPTFNMRFVYYSGDALQMGITAARDGKFEFRGHSPRPTLVEIYDNDFRLLGRAYTQNGQTIDMKLDRVNPYNVEASGSEVMEAWSRVQRDNAEALLHGGAAANDVVMAYADAHRDNLVSALLLVTNYDAALNAAGADSLLAMLEPQARPGELVESFNYLLERLVTARATGEINSVKYVDRSDSVRVFNPSNSAYSLIVMSDSHSGRKDSIVPNIKKLRKAHDDKRLHILDFSLEPDTLSWRRSTRIDSADWRQGWAAGGVSAPDVAALGIPRVPFFIVCDSTGAQIYRGPSVSAALDTIASRTGKTL